MNCEYQLPSVCITLPEPEKIMQMPLFCAMFLVLCQMKARLNVRSLKRQNKFEGKNHKFEGKQLVKNYIPDVLLGIEYLWSGCMGGKYEVNLETTEIYRKKPSGIPNPMSKTEYEYKNVLYTMKEKRISKRNL